MKYLILVADGAADEKIEALGGKTPLETACMPNINGLAKKGLVGMVSTVPEGIAPGSDAANLSVMGYDPRVYLTGRSPLEAASIGIDMSDTDVAFRCNIVTLAGDGPYEDKIVLDHSSGDITTEEADELIRAVNEKFGNETVQFYTGVSYRHCMIVKNGETNYDLTPPHDILTKRAGDHMPKGEGSQFIADMMRESYELLSGHPVNLRRMEKGLNPANSLWIWGQGKKPALSSFYDKYKISGATISAVDLIKGIGICAGLKSVDVPGATGTIHTNFDGKGKAAIQQFKEGMDFVYLHLEAPDECSHQGDMEGKIRSLELIDEKVMGQVIDYLDHCGEDYKVLVLPDHQTPLSIRTHAGRPVPFVLYNSARPEAEDESKVFGETSGAASDLFFANGYELTDFFFCG
ncbi:cofactor-independent phosphoglycerate mutase [Bacilliculturomica massiliensis]|uniref:cofactor-independent phosphoglycerate mutase n=1 Tax=Bacilliculturomica massiliensis TaxID=1917867 RepID=UPI001031AF5A|nr:cofactor-independent phosphoglycerate mutase [Bacilliculturomica massiliensis]